ncbi:hypothetical protein PIB30_028438 [Stylosanthes scabra]|uniref:Ribosomal protein L18 n=1 Tax=Stylosanthes scabra TaxID=79078 RepID=A0ABU6W916_9FABA|nr:hypothetical protein [Stylosanthes scabra]
MMVFFLARRSASLYNQRFLLTTSSFWFKYLTTIPNKDDAHETAASFPPSQSSNTVHLSPFLSNFDQPPSGYNIELVDGDAWGVSSGVAQAWSGRHSAKSAAAAATTFGHHGINEPVDCNPSHAEDDMDFEDIDNMRVRGNLFYKLERSSKEFEEYNLEFHRKKSSKKKDDNKKENSKETKKAKACPNPNVTSNSKDHIAARSRIIMPRSDEIKEVSPENKRQRTPTFNQLTGPYHEPFCLDIYISKGSVRACVVHRVTSKVVAVAHSISKDMKFDLASTKNKTTCAAVGAILAQRALADDIHDVIYTLRKGEKLEGKLHIVLKSIIDNGINVKVKIKQRFRRSIKPHST